VKTSPKRSYSVIENERFGLVFAKTGSIISGTGGQKLITKIRKNVKKFHVLWIRIRIDFGRLNPDPDPGGPKLPAKKLENC
jgi:hypothetical protein